MKQTLNEQIALTKFHSLREFRERLQDGKLMMKAQIELLFLRDTFKFECYVKKYQLDQEVERRLIQSGRKDLFCIYFKYRRCTRSTESLLIHYPKALSIYAKYHALGESVQMAMVKQKKMATTLQYIKRRELCGKALLFFREHAEKKLVVIYDDIWMTYGK